MTQNYLKCNYVADHPYLLIGPVKQEILSLKPWVVIYRDVISERTAKNMKNIYDPSKLFRSTTTNNAGQMLYKILTHHIYEYEKYFFLQFKGPTHLVSVSSNGYGQIQINLQIN